MIPDVEILRSIKTFPSLVKYLRDELDWPIDSDDVDDLIFEYQPEELGLDPKTRVKIKEIKQLRPLKNNQPWGIFFVNFEPKQLPVVVLRRILQALAIKRIPSAGKSHQQTWHPHDLLFISSYGETEHRDLSFAHFAENPETGDLPTLRVLGWDDEDTVLHIEHAHKTLKEKLHWPQDIEDISAWRQSWSSAFTLRHREIINTSKAMAIRLAQLAMAIRKRANRILAVESESGPLRKLHTSFREALIHDLSPDDFADMYAQTITYGLLSARVSRSADIIADNIKDMVPVTNPFLRELLSTFLTVGGRKGKIDFDEMGINDVVQALRDANMEAVLRDFGDRNPQEDPVIHFYELFLKEYDPKKKMQRGVFYTPRPVVSYIVRSVHEVLQKEFNLKDGLADTSTWNDMVQRFKDLKIPEGARPEDAFVCIIDPACGTGTFLVEVIDIIDKTMKAKWRKEGQMEYDIPRLWNEYVTDHLLPRLYGYELMMAPYAVAHMKIGIKLFETGYSFASDERARIYLTNSLEPPQEFSDRLAFDAPALAHEAYSVNAVKRSQRFTIIIGNPPYAGHSWNLTPELRKMVDPYRFVNGERIKEKGALQLEKSIQDDYVKFFRFAELHISNCSIGLLGLVTSHGFLDNDFLRGMRYSALSTFSKLFVLDLHGNALRHEKSSDGSQDKNIFDIQRTGVAISLFRKTNDTQFSEVRHSEILGDRDTVKYPWLNNNTLYTIPTKLLEPHNPSYLLVPQNSENQEEYVKGYALNEVMTIYSKGVVTGRDSFVIDFDESTLLERMYKFTDPKNTNEELIEELDLNPSAWWDVTKARKNMPPRKHFQKHVRPLLYRPFDIRLCFYHPSVFMSPRKPVMKHMLSGSNNFLLITSRMTKGETFQHIAVAKGLTEAIFLSSKTSNNAIVFPLYEYPRECGIEPSLAFGQSRMPNFTKAFMDAIHGRLGLSVTDGVGDFKKNIGAEDILYYFVAILHSPSYRFRYNELLKRNFPRLPLTYSVDLFRGLAKHGGALVSFYLMESDKLNKHITKWTGQIPSGEVERVTWSEDIVWINKFKTEGFKGVPDNVWNFHVGGYQVCEKWLKDRKGRQLSKDDIEHYQKIIVALNETIKIMAEIDKTIDAHGGWPGAFVTKE